MVACAHQSYDCEFDSIWILSVGLSSVSYSCHSLVHYFATAHPQFSNTSGMLRSAGSAPCLLVELRSSSPTLCRRPSLQWTRSD